MWFLSFIPDAWLQWFIYGLLSFGVLLYVIGFLKNLPIIGPYAGIIRQLSIIIIIVSVFFEGGYGVEMSYRAKIAEMENKIKIAETQSKEVNVKIQTKIVERVKIIKEHTDETSREIEKNRDAINAECKLSDDAWLFYNRTVKNVLARSTTKSN